MSDEDHFVIQATEVRLSRSPEGQLVLHQDDSAQSVGSVMSVFPLTRPARMVALRDADGDEIGILDDVRKLDPASRGIMAEELERAYFMPAINDILDVREELRVVTWDVVTDKGPRTFQVRHVRQNVRRMGRRRLVIKDVDGNRYEIRDWLKLPPFAQKMIQIYL